LFQGAWGSADGGNMLVEEMGNSRKMVAGTSLKPLRFSVVFYAEEFSVHCRYHAAPKSINGEALERKRQSDRHRGQAPAVTHEPYQF
jgi:hypothetical protein